LGSPIEVESCEVLRYRDW
jgi:hypothetical protein